jgi:hypothetical protein
MAGWLLFFTLIQSLDRPPREGDEAAPWMRRNWRTSMLPMPFGEALRRYDKHYVFVTGRFADFRLSNGRLFFFLFRDIEDKSSNERWRWIC